MAAPVIVPDASVILKWVLPADDEPDTERALALREAIANDDVQAFVPSLWLFEVGNTVARRFPDVAARWLAALRKFELDDYPPSRLWLTTVLELTQRYNVTFYDAAYHAIAIIQQGMFVTADTRYVNRAGDAGAITKLSDWTRP